MHSGCHATCMHANSTHSPPGTTLVVLCGQPESLPYADMAHADQGSEGPLNNIHSALTPVEPPAWGPQCLNVTLWGGRPPASMGPGVWGALQFCPTWPTTKTSTKTPNPCSSRASLCGHGMCMEPGHSEPRSGLRGVE